MVQKTRFKDEPQSPTPRLKSLLQFLTKNILSQNFFIDAQNVNENDTETLLVTFVGTIIDPFSEDV